MGLRTAKIFVDCVYRKSDADRVSDLFGVSPPVRSQMPAADDAAEIWPRLMRLRRICFRKLDLPVSTCWCLKAGPDGRDVPCSEANDPTPWDLLGKSGAAEPTKLQGSGSGSINLSSPIRYRSFREAFGDAAADELEKWAAGQGDETDLLAKPGVGCVDFIIVNINERPSYRWRIPDEGEED